MLLVYKARITVEFLTNFSDLLEKLTKSSKPVVMNPVAVTSKEAEFVRRMIIMNEEKKKK